MVSKSKGRVLLRETSLRKSSRGMAAVAMWEGGGAVGDVAAEDGGWLWGGGSAARRACCLSMQAAQTLRKPPGGPRRGGKDECGPVYGQREHFWRASGWMEKDCGGGVDEGRPGRTAKEKGWGGGGGVEAGGGGGGGAEADDAEGGDRISAATRTDEKTDEPWMIIIAQSRQHASASSEGRHMTGTSRGTRVMMSSVHFRF